MRRCALIAAIALLAACASTGPAPVDDLSGASARARTAAAPPSPPAASYRVQRGDTLYSIAFRNGLDYRELANWNGIGAPYTIYVGQEIRLGAARRNVAGMRPATPVIAGSTSVATVAPVTQPANAGVARPTPFENVSASPAPANASPATAAVPASNAVATAQTAVAPPPASTPPPAAAPPPAPLPVATASGGDILWRWPADGSLVGSYLAGDQTRQGIDIAGKSGDPVRAAAAGTVVYSGNGLIGYGELIIVKHNPAFLSAYGHNRKRLVKEGDRVGSGQTIAEMGSSSASRDSLHFEIRKNGKPVNPADYLPRR